MDINSEFNILIYQGVLRTAISILHFKSTLNDEEIIRQESYWIAVRQTKIAFEVIFGDKMADSKNNVNIIAEAASEMWGSAKILSQHYEEICKKTLLQIDNKQNKGKYIRQCNRIFKSIMRVRDKDISESDGLISVLSEMHYYFNVQSSLSAEPDLAS